MFDLLFSVACSNFSCRTSTNRKGCLSMNTIVTFYRYIWTYTLLYHDIIKICCTNVVELPFITTGSSDWL